MQKIDLNNLIPSEAVITIGDEELALQPATLRALFVINKVVSDLRSMTVSGDEADKLSKELRDELNSLCPGLDKHELNGAQLLKLADIVAARSLPQTELVSGTGVSPDPKADTE